MLFKPVSTHSFVFSNNKWLRSVSVLVTQLTTQAMDTSTGPEIDEALYSRQLYVLGHEAMKKMNASNVLIGGLSGLGVEIGEVFFFFFFPLVSRISHRISSNLSAKNVILGGVKSVCLQDTQPCTLNDLSSQVSLQLFHNLTIKYFLSERDIGRNRAEASHGPLAELNPYVTVKAVSSPITKELVSEYNVIVLTQSSLDEQIEIGNITHGHGKILIVADARGLFG